MIILVSLICNSPSRVPSLVFAAIYNIPKKHTAKNPEYPIFVKNRLNEQQHKI